MNNIIFDWISIPVYTVELDYVEVESHSLKIHENKSNIDDIDDVKLESHSLKVHENESNIDELDDVEVESNSLKRNENESNQSISLDRAEIKSGNRISIDSKSLNYKKTEFLYNGRYKHEFKEEVLIGFGGFGKVYRALQTLEKQYYAMKKVNIEGNVAR